MFRRSLIIALVLLTVPVAAATWVWSPVLLMAPPSEDKTPEAVASAKPVALEQPTAKTNLPDLSALAPRTSAPDKPQFDVARIEPDGGWSIFAGTAPPNTFVAITADGIVIGSTKADANGEWTLMSDHRFSTKSPALSLSTTEAPKPVAVASAPTTSTAAPRSALTRLASPEPHAAPSQTTATAGAPARPAPQAAAPKASAEEATRSMMQNLEKMVAEARAQPVQPAEPASTTPATTSAAAATSPPTADAASVSTPAPPAAQTAMMMTAPTPPAVAKPAPPTVAQPAPAPVPVPIQFVYGEATFTAEGQDAASLLLEYVKLKNPERLSMTGHADERGSDSFNLDLSRRRLQAVADYLRDNGYRGTFALAPKGRSEPFQGVDRSRFTRDALYQLDRRVEFTLEAALRRSAEDGGSGANRSN